MDYSTLRDLRPVMLTLAANAYTMAAGQFEQTGNDWSGQVYAATTSNWTGRAADLATPQLRVSDNRLRDCRFLLVQAADQLSSAAAQFTALQDQLAQVGDGAVQLGLLIQDDGSIEPDPQNPPSFANMVALNALTQAIRENIAVILTQADVVDQVTSQALDMVALSIWSDVATAPGRGGQAAPGSNGRSGGRNAPAA
jgi:hypothetical protein